MSEFYSSIRARPPKLTPLSREINFYRYRYVSIFREGKGEWKLYVAAYVACTLYSMSRRRRERRKTTRRWTCLSGPSRRTLCPAASASRGGRQPRAHPRNIMLVSFCKKIRVKILPVFRIHDILVWIRIWIRIHGSMPLTNGSGSGSC